MAGLWYTETLKGLELRSEVGLVLEGKHNDITGFAVRFSGRIRFRWQDHGTQRHCRV